mgnify:FL=1
MDKLRYLLLLLITFFTFTIVLGQEQTDLTEQSQDLLPVTKDLLLNANLTDSAAQAFRDMDYKKSIELYEKSIEQGVNEGKVSAQIYYNLGNAYFKDNQLGKSILNFERALLLDPGDGDIRHNLRFANNKTVDRINPAGNIFLSNWFNAVRNLFSSDTWATIGVVLFVLFLISVAIYLFVSKIWARKSAFYTGIVVFIFMIVANVFAFSQKRERLRGDSAIVMVGAARVNASPDINSNELFELHEGTKVRVRGKDGNWYEIEIENGSVGWTMKENVEII